MINTKHPAFPPTEKNNTAQNQCNPSIYFWLHVRYYCSAIDLLLRKERTGKLGFHTDHSCY